MARSTKLERLITDPLNARLTTAEAKVDTIETRDLVELGDNISGLANDAGYQNATQVDAKITAVVGTAPAALDTLGEIAAALADDDDAIAALVAQDTANASAITAIQNVNTTQDTAIATLQASVGKVALGFDPGENTNYPVPKYLNLGYGFEVDTTTFPNYFTLELQPAVRDSIIANESTIAAVQTELADLDASDIPVLTAPVAYNIVDPDGIPLSNNVENNLSFINSTLINLANNYQSLFLEISGDQTQLNRLFTRTSIRRLNITVDTNLTNDDYCRQHVINQSGSDRLLELPSNPITGQEFEVINNAASTSNLIFAGETIIPGTRHAVQWDGVEWVVM